MFHAILKQNWYGFHDLPRTVLDSSNCNFCWVLNLIGLIDQRLMLWLINVSGLISKQFSKKATQPNQLMIGKERKCLKRGFDTQYSLPCTMPAVYVANYCSLPSFSFGHVQTKEALRNRMAVYILTWTNNTGRAIMPHLVTVDLDVFCHTWAAS